jgi:hypothetical protein
MSALPTSSSSKAMLEWERRLSPIRPFWLPGKTKPNDACYVLYADFCFRNMEDFVTWVDSSKIKKNIMKYRDAMDDFDLL